MAGEDAVGGLFDLGHAGGEVVGRDGLAVDLDALGEAMEVGAGVEAGGDAGGPQQRGDHGGDAAFALAAGDVDGGAAEVRVVELFEQGEHRRDVGAIGEAAGALEVGQAVEVTQGFDVVHAGRG